MACGGQHTGQVCELPTGTPIEQFPRGDTGLVPHHEGNGRGVQSTAFRATVRGLRSGRAVTISFTPAQFWGFQVEDVRVARDEELQSRGVKFMKQEPSGDESEAWIYFRGPDGYLWTSFG